MVLERDGEGSGASYVVDISTGDSVIYGQYAGAEAVLEGTPYKVVRSSECMAKW